MANKLQISKKYDDGTIVMAGGETTEEFDANYAHMRKIAQDAGLGQKPAGKIASEGKPEWFFFVTESDCVIEIIHKGEEHYGEMSPVPGTKYAVRVWPEVLKAAGIDPAVGVANVPGLTCAYTKNDKGYPQKIVVIEGYDSTLAGMTVEEEEIPF